MSYNPYSRKKLSQIYYKHFQEFQKIVNVYYKFANCNLLISAPRQDQSLLYIYNTLIKLYYQTMNNDQLFFHNLTDFRDLKSFSKNKPEQTYSSNRSSHTNNSNNNLTPQFELEMHSNEKLMKNFKDLRQQLKQSNKNIQKLTMKVAEQQSEIERYKKSQKQYLATNYNTKCEIDQLKTSNQDYRSKFQYLQELASKSTHQKEEVEYLKMLTYQLKNKLEKSENQNKKIMEISVIEKVELQQKIKKLEAKKSSDLEYVQEMEIQISKYRQKNIKLENQLKKAEIKYDQELYNKKWLNGNFQREHLEQQLQQLEKEFTQLTAKHKKEKQKRNNLEKRVLELEEMAGIWNVKAEAYQVENKNYQKKFKKTQKKMAQLKEDAANHLQEALSWQEKFLKSLSISQELISRVKRDLYGDVVSLAKSCQYKFNKLKQEKQPFIKSSEPRKSPSISKIRAKSKPGVIKQNYEVSPIKTVPQFPNHFQNGEQQKNPALIYQKMNLNPTINNGNDYKERSSSRKFTSIDYNKYQNDNKMGYNKENGSSLRDEDSQRLPFAHVQNIDLKIRKERQQMQRRIKQKMLYRKIQVTTNSPQKHRLREDYFRLIEK